MGVAVGSAVLEGPYEETTFIMSAITFSSFVVGGGTLYSTGFGFIGCTGGSGSVFLTVGSGVLPLS